MEQREMSTLSAVGAGLQAALLLARGRRDGVALIAASPDVEAASASRSFWAMALCLPALVAQHLLTWAQTGLPPHAAHQFALDLLTDAIGWIAFTLLSHRVAAMLGRSARWPRFIAAWNWCNVVQFLIVLVGTGLPQLLRLPDMVQQTAWLVAVGWALWLEWYAIRLTLEVPPLQAVALVTADGAMSLFLLGLTGAG
jgi:hypothetical protein